uniref:Thermospermine synthase ACAULIS5-like n=1 Tax=Cicer arietinum TaxID=3827 RepID=A0A3Q7YAT2_CICAR|nr:thermospermine synthase ACAULIS5-like [Cicer arietinum]
MRSFVIVAIMILLIPRLEDGFFDLEFLENYYAENDLNEDETSDDDNYDDDEHWLETEIDYEVKWLMGIESTECEKSSDIQNLTLLSTRRYGKALVIDGLLQSSELDEYVYHESLVHPSLLIHHEPKNVFIMGGGGGYAAREVLKHKHVEKVVICEIDKEVVNLCREHMTGIQDTFNDKRVQIVFNDAKDELLKWEEKIDIIIGDVCDPSESSPSNNLYVKSFYEHVVKPKLKGKGIFVTQAGPAGIFSHKTMFSLVYVTLKQVFAYVVAYTALVPSYGDACGWIMASDEPINIEAKQLDKMIDERIRGSLKYLDGSIIAASTVLNKPLKKSLDEETYVLTEENICFVRGHVQN